MTDALVNALSALGGILLRNCNLLEWCGLLVLLGVGKYFGQQSCTWFVKLRAADRPWYWRYLTVVSVTPVACLLLFLCTGSVPVPAVPDEWSHLFLADTLLEGRFSNPAHPLPQFFEAIHILPEPTRSSMYFFGPALWLAAGKLLFGNALWGIALAGAILSAVLLWGLEAMIEKQWAWLGTMLFTLKAVCGGIWGAYWIQSYWGGVPGALAGTLITAGVWRMATVAGNPWICGSAIGAGAALLMVTRPFEGLALCAGLALGLIRVPVRKLAFAAIPALLIVGGTAAVMRVHFQAVTGDPGKLPYTRNQEIYGWPMTLPWIQVTEPAIQHEDMKAYWDWERREHETPFLIGALKKAGLNWQHYIGGFLAVPFLLAFRRWRTISATAIWLPFGAVVTALLIEQTGYPHYLSPAAGAIAACIAFGCRAWPDRSPWLPLGLATIFLVRLLTPPAVTPESAAPSICCRYQMGAERQRMVDELTRQPGTHLVFVPNTIRMGSNNFYGWVYNAPDMDRARIVFARDLGSEKNRELIQYYPERKVWRAGPGIPLQPLTDRLP